MCDTELLETIMKDDKIILLLNLFEREREHLVTRVGELDLSAG